MQFNASRPGNLKPPRSTLASGDSEETQDLTVPENRNCTNTSFLVTFTICFLFLLFFFAVLSWGGDMNRFFFGHDKYGNTCGIKNKPIRAINFSGQDMTSKRITKLKYFPIKRCLLRGEQKLISYKCVDSCNPPSELIFNRCYPPQQGKMDKESMYAKQLLILMHVFTEYFFTIVLMAITGLVLSFAIYFIVKCSIVATFWALVVFQFIITILAASLFMHKYMTSDNDRNAVLFLLMAMGSLGYALFIILFLFILRDSLELMFRLYRGSINAVFRMPSVLFQPFVTITALVILTTVLIIFIILTVTNGCLKQSTSYPFTYEYDMNVVRFACVCVIAFMILWSFAFAQGWQCMIVSGAMGQYYFTSNKLALVHPVGKSFQILIHYHLGTLACGSLIMALFSFMGVVVEYILRKVYILTALHGDDIWKSIKRAIKLLTANLIHTVAITVFNYFITYGFTLFVIMTTVAVGVWMNLENLFNYYILYSIILGAIITSIIAFFIIQVLYIASDSFFLYLCEEQAGDNEHVKKLYVSGLLENSDMSESKMN